MQSHSNTASRAPRRRDTRPSVCAVCGKPVTGLMVKDENLSTVARSKYWGACSAEHAKLLKGGRRVTKKVSANLAIVNDDSADVARRAAGEFIKSQHSSDLRQWSPTQSKAFIRAIIQAYLNCEFDNK